MSKFVKISAIRLDPRDSYFSESNYNEYPFQRFSNGKLRDIILDATDGRRENGWGIDLNQNKYSASIENFENELSNVFIDMTVNIDSINNLASFPRPIVVYKNLDKSEYKIIWGYEFSPANYGPRDYTGWGYRYIYFMPVETYNKLFNND